MGLAVVPDVLHHEEYVDRIMNEDRFREVVYDELLRKVYARLRKP